MPRPLALLACTLAVTSGLLFAQPIRQPFVPVGAIYDSLPGVPRDRTALDLQAISRRGFNTVVTRLTWAEGEPSRGQYRFDPLSRVLELAPTAGLRVVVRLDTTAAPEWVLRRYPDARFAADNKAGPGPGEAAIATPRACLDHPDVRAAALGFVRAATERASYSGAWLATDVTSEPTGLCVCAQTERRFKAWATASGETDRGAFVRASLRDDLMLIAAAASNSGTRPVVAHTRAPSILHPGLVRGPGQDDWLMAPVVDRYGAGISGSVADRANPGASLLPLVLDGLAAAAREKGWWLHGPGGDDAQDARVAAWGAMSRGAAGLLHANWRDASGFAGVISRNPALFASLRPRPPKLAILHDPRGNDGTLLAAAHRALLEQNIPVDFVHENEILNGAADRYRVVVRVSRHDLADRVARALQAHVAAGGAFIDAASERVSGPRLIQLAGRAGVVPDVRISGSNGLVEARFLESANVLMLIALNHADSSRRVTLTFTPDTQEAIWLNMETGTGVDFVAGPEGPSYNYWFRARDALVLMIRKDMR